MNSTVLDTTGFTMFNHVFLFIITVTMD